MVNSHLTLGVYSSPRKVGAIWNAICNINKGPIYSRHIGYLFRAKIYKGLLRAEIRTYTLG